MISLTTIEPITAQEIAAVNLPGALIALGIGVAVWLLASFVIAGIAKRVAEGSTFFKKRHFRWVGMRLTLWQLACWSFLMSSAHGAGLMLLPVLTHGAVTVPGHSHGMTSGAGSAVMAAIFVTGVHTLAMFVVAGTIAVIVYEVVGLAILRRAWFNLDRVWAAALIGAGAATLLITA